MLFAALLAPALLTCQLATAADPAQPAFRPLPGIGSELAGSAAGEEPGEIRFDVSLTAESLKPGEIATLAIHAILPPKHYTYAASEKQGFTTQLKVTETFGLEPVDDGFQPDHSPKEVYEPVLKKDLYKHFGDVVWSRRFRISSDAILSEIAASATLRGQYCGEGVGGQCRLIPTKTFRVALTQGKPPVSATAAAVKAGGTDPAKTSAGGFHPLEATIVPTRGKEKKADPLEYRFRLSPAGAAVGELVTLSITTTLEDDWHIFALTQNPANYGKPTEIKVSQLHGLKPAGDGWKPSAPAKREEPLKDGKIQHTHYGQITWSRQFQVTEAGAGGYGASGELKYQICSHGQCLPPRPVQFSLGNLTAARPAAEAANQISGAVATTRLENVEFRPQDEEEEGSLPLFLLYAFVGGMLLNVMPCVLPVIAIKVLSFVQQAGESRARVFALNATYSAGVISVFLVLAALAAFFSLGWGGLFQSSAFNLAMACIVFAMGLSLLGVFEIPVPGMVGSAAGQNQQEGLTGAFFTGVFATLLATPCTGPFMSSTLAWSVQQSTVVIFLVWAMMGLGMASPYLVFGLIPGAVRLLPRPGAWMERFKELAGFVLMATVIFFIYFLDRALTIPLLVMLLGIALGVWMVGNLYDYTAPAKKKWTIRAVALLLGGGIALAGYGMRETFERREQQFVANEVSRVLAEMGTTNSSHSPEAVEGESHLSWQPFSGESLQTLLNERKTVLVDFTADWCLICKQNEQIALNTAETQQFVEQHGIVPLYADYTKKSPEIQQWLDRLNSIGVPLTAIFPAENPSRPILLRGPFTRAQLLEKLQQAVET
ncbi:MAG: thioredoxin family protein, partial [Planctomycetaceae bacterium]|nr:thioredoxin family protein [Planctomycetaceae bacterium]